MVLVLTGRVEIELGDELIVLKPGDCIYFDASTSHRSRCLGKTMSRALVVVSVP
jgi:mannose-6-phosphate isomerase-like protein (cupin superfamily)